jgi:recombinational DNA repair protein (RecF pathway)
MSYQTYITDALVCGAKPSNTSDQSYLLFTRNAGMLFATARSVREERSRQRFALQEFSYVRATLIKGKAGWRIGSVEAHKNYYQLATNQASRVSVVAIFRQLRRYIQGEEPADELFDFCLEALELAFEERPNSEEFNQIVSARMLFVLGYISRSTLPSELLDTPLNAVSGALSATARKQLTTALEQAEAASHL